jgi:hypothetical protein
VTHIWWISGESQGTTFANFSFIRNGSELAMERRAGTPPQNVIFLAYVGYFAWNHMRTVTGSRHVTFSGFRFNTQGHDSLVGIPSRPVVIIFQFADGIKAIFLSRSWLLFSRALRLLVLLLSLARITWSLNSQEDISGQRIAAVVLAWERTFTIGWRSRPTW